MDSMTVLAETLNSIHKSTFHDEKSRMEVAIAARQLADRIERPWERMYSMIISVPQTIIALKVATNVGLWPCLSTTPQTSAELAKKTGADREFLRRILRMLITMGVVEEVAIDKFIETDLSKALADPNGLVRGLDIHHKFGCPQMQRVPEYFKHHGHRFPEDIKQAPINWVMERPDYQGSFWQMIDEMEMSASFNSFLSGVRQFQPSWPTVWPVEEKLLDGWDGKSVLLVDVGGGKGRDVSNLGEAIQDTHPNARLVLQDRPGVVEEAKASGLHPQVETVPHDFFKPNPVQGARAYYEHAVVHDWPDKEGREILLNMKAGMIPGYSKMLLMEVVMPESCKEVDTKLAGIDLQMGINFCAMERTAEQWKELLKSAGMKYIGHQPVYGKTCIIEAEIDK